ncbi:MAG TPA: tetratricopeptide repeat protein, partial [Polyangiaceae bacterium]|nr:tetratricopeptide repeat protein [Polyangiaceae bacterium]
PPSAGADAASSGPTVPPAPSATATAAPSAAAAPKVQKGKVVIEKSIARAYADGLKKGRTETLAKRYDAAVAGFDAALVALPGDARAISERGYARLLAGKYDAARADLREAESRTKDPKLLAQIHFNHGLVAEKLNRADEAKASFARSNSLNPTKAAAAKLTGGAACEAVVALGTEGTFVANSWAAAYEALRTADPQASADTKLGTEAAAKERLCARAPAGHCEDVLSFSTEAEATSWAFHPVLKVDGGYLIGKEALSERYDMPCGGDEKLVITESGGLRMLRFENETGMRVPVCAGTNGDELSDCGPNDIPVTSACGTAPASLAVAIFDVAKKKLAATVRASGDDKKPPVVTLEGRTLKVSGAGCNVRTDL